MAALATASTLLRRFCSSWYWGPGVIFLSVLLYFTADIQFQRACIKVLRRLLKTVALRQACPSCYPYDTNFVKGVLSSLNKHKRIGIVFIRVLYSTHGLQP